ncbi:MAG: hypothetical protein LAO04_13370, partial [Acidobacteriia bacterium]|nr:hypothetical protein [Terriglobia bacterium]
SGVENTVIPAKAGIHDRNHELRGRVSDSPHALGRPTESPLWGVTRPRLPIGVESVKTIHELALKKKAP